MENEFSEFVRNMRKASGMSTKKLALRMGCSQATISNYENGVKVPKETALFEIQLREVVKEEIRRRRELEYAEAY